MNEDKLQTWMFREKYEILSLFSSVLIVLFLLYTFATINPVILAISTLIAFMYIKLQQAQLVGNALEVGPSQFDEIFETFQEYKRSLRINNAKLYISQDPNPNAFTIGFPMASIILNSAIVENYTPDELSFVIAHELGHVKAGHNVILTFLSPLGSSIPGASLIFGSWQRKAECSADKCGLALTKKIDPAIISLLKLSIGLKLASKVDLQSYKNQLINSKGGLVRISELMLDHPLVTNRIRKLVSFWKSSFKQLQ